MVQLILDFYQGSNLLPGKNSSKMTQKGQENCPVFPDRYKLHHFLLQVFNLYAGDSGL
jgi:hypothetical protein